METLNKALPEDEQDILIRHVSAVSVNTVGKNIYVDNGDGAEFDEDDLSFLERGHYYSYVIKKVGDGVSVHVHSPYRTFDEETLLLTNKLRSLRAEEPMKKFHPALSKNRSCLASILKDFSMSTEDFSTFRKKIEEFGGVCVDGSTSLSEVQELQDKFMALVEQTSMLLAKILNIIVDMETNEEFLQGCKLLEEFKDCRSEVYVLSTSLSKAMDKLSGEHAPTNTTSSSTIAKKFLEVDIANLLAQLNASKQLRVRGKSVQKYHLGDLRAEIHKLKPYFKQLDSLRAEKEGEEEVLVLSLIGINIRLTSSGVTAEGDPTAIYRYLGQQAPNAGDELLYQDKRAAGVHTLTLDEEN